MTYNVIQWATGGVGQEALRQVIAAPDLELVGVFVYTEEKNGRDAGELAGTTPIGVSATTDRQAILDLDADVVLHMPLGASMEALDDDVIAPAPLGQERHLHCRVLRPVGSGRGRAAAPDRRVRSRAGHPARQRHRARVRVRPSGADPQWRVRRGQTRPDGRVREL